MNNEDNTAFDTDADYTARQRRILQEDFIGNVTLHGYRYLFTASTKKRRFIWWICFFAALIFAIYLFHGTVSDYFKYKSYTVTENDYDIGQLELPSLTLCYNQPYTKKNKNNLPFKVNNKFMKLIYHDVIRVRSKKISKDGHDALKKLSKYNISTYEQLVELFTINTNVTFQDPILQSMFNGTCKLHGKRCVLNDFKTILDQSFAPCQQYNYFTETATKNLPKIQSLPSRIHWFEAYFNIEQKSAYGKSKLGEGMTLFIHDRKRPHSRQSDIAITLKPGRLTTISFEEHITMTSLPPPYGKCGSVDYQIIKKIPYSYPMCKFDCRLAVRYRICGCVAFNYKDFVENIPICSIEQMVQCYKKTPQNSKHASSDSCRKRCVQECVQNRFPLRIETDSLLSSRNIARVRLVDRNSSYKQIEKTIKQNVVGVRVGFSRILQINEVTTESITFASMLGTIGGSIGLGLGFSVLTLVEFVLFFVDYIYFCLPSSSKKRVNSKQGDEQQIELRCENEIR